MVSVRKLRILSKHADIDYKYFNSNILEIRKGKIASIKNPPFPFRMGTPEIGAILEFVCSDGWIHIDKKARMTKRTSYSSDDQESFDAFIENINKVFGEVYFQMEVIRNHTRIKIGSGIIGDALEKSGGIVGNKTKMNGPVPWVVRKGSLKIKKAYLRAVFNDEGSLGRLKNPYVTLSRYNLFNLTKTEKNTLDKHIEKEMKTHKFPTGHIHKKITFKKAVEIITNSNIKNEKSLIRTLGNSIPKLLLGESKILKENFGIENSIRIRSLNKTGSGYYTLGCDLFIRRKNVVVKFHKNIGFILSRKQNKLEKYLLKRGFI